MLIPRRRNKLLMETLSLALESRHFPGSADWRGLWMDHRQPPCLADQGDRASQLRLVHQPVEQSRAESPWGWEIEGS